MPSLGRAVLPASDPDALTAAVAALRAGEIIGIPTETVYGIGAVPRVDSLAALIRVKQRPEEKGIALLIDGLDQVEMLVELPPAALRLARAHWPGALTLVLPVRRASSLPDELTGGRDTLGLRIPDHPVPRALARALGPLAVTSANLSGGAPATTVAQLMASVGHALALVLDDGPVRGGVASTVVTVDADDAWCILRAGALDPRHHQRHHRRRLSADAYTPRTLTERPTEHLMTLAFGRQSTDQSIAHVDPELWEAMVAERERQTWKIELIASENYVSAAVLEAAGSWLTNKYAEGQPGRRYYGGCEYVDVVERLAEERALALFPGAEFVNVQPHSGAQANIAAYLSVLEHGDTILGMSLAHGGHLTHGHPDQLQRPLLRCPRLRRVGGRRPYRLCGPRAPSRRSPAQAGGGGCECLLAHHRLRAHGRHRTRCGRIAVRGHGPHRWTRRGWPAPQPVRPR